MLNVAIIGTGAISAAHIAAYLTFPARCRIAAVCDIYPDKAAAKVEQFQLQAEVYADYEDIVKRDDIDLVSICTPPYTHAELSIAFLQAGKHTIVEKPMASSLEECDRMIAAAEKSGRLLSVIAQNRFTTPMMKLKNVLESGLTGPINHVQVDSYWWRGYNYYDLWWRGTWEKEGGGCTLNHAVHHLDIFQWMNGMPEEITAMMSNTSHDNAEVEDISVAIARYKNGALAQLTSSVVHHGEEQQIIFQGQHARVSAPWKVTTSKAKANGFPEEDPILTAKIQTMYDELPKLEHEGHKGQIADVLSAIENLTAVLVDGQQGRQTLELITAIYQAASTGQSVKLPLQSDSLFYTREGLLSNVRYFYEKKNSVENFQDNTITFGGS